MKAYSEWQTALTDFILQYGHNYQDSYNLVSEFEQMLSQNRNGTYFLEVENDTSRNKNITN